MFVDKDLSPRQTFLLKRFVDRKRELTRFCEMLDSNEHLIFLVTGESDIGKSTFMARLIDESRRRGWYRAVVPCDLMTNVDYRSIMRRLRSEIGQDYFAEFDRADKEFGQPVFRLKLEGNGDTNISVADGAQIGHSSVRDITGIKANVEQLNISPEYLDNVEEERRATLTYHFIDCLASACNDARLVIFFDAIENMASEVERWVMDELVVAAVTGTLRNVKFVQCGQRRPAVKREIDFAVKETTLEPLGENDIIEYLAKRGIDSGRPEEDARILRARTNGFAGRIAKFVDAYEQEQVG